jgi:hypothetical protein
MPEEEFEPLMAAPYGVDPVRTAELFGFGSTVPSTPAELDEALLGDARMIVVRTDRRRNLELHRELAEAAAASVARA